MPQPVCPQVFNRIQGSSQGNGQGQQASSPSPSSSPGNSNPNSTSDNPVGTEPMRSIVASHNNNGMFIFWQKQNGDLWMHAYYGTIHRWTDAIKLSNPNLPATNNTPISAIAWLNTDYFVSPWNLRPDPTTDNMQEVRVYYTSNVAQMIQMVFSCNADGTSCSPPSNSQLDGVSALSPGQGSVITSPSPSMLRHYHVNADGLIAETVYNWTDNSNRFRAPRPISTAAKAHKNSPIAANVVGDTIYIYWFDDERRLWTARSVATTSSWSGCKSYSYLYTQLVPYLHPAYTSQVEFIPTATIPTRLPRALGLANATTPQLYFLDGTKLQQIVLSRTPSTNAISSSTLEFNVPNGPLGVVAWSNSSPRLYFPVNGGKGIMEGAASDRGGWGGGLLKGDSYD